MTCAGCRDEHRAGARLRCGVDRVLPLADVEEAFAALREGRPVGRNVLAV